MPELFIGLRAVRPHLRLSPACLPSSSGSATEHSALERTAGSGIRDEQKAGERGAGGL